MIQVFSIITLTVLALTVAPIADAMAMEASRRAFLNQATITGAFISGLTPSISNAYERRDVGAEGSMSAATYAFNEQAYKTNNRLEAEGFKLDTREEEKAKLSAAMASFSYDSSMTTKKKTTYGSSSSKTSSNSKAN